MRRWGYDAPRHDLLRGGLNSGGPIVGAAVVRAERGLPPPDKGLYGVLIVGIKRVGSGVCLVRVLI